jgi:hypothetical protein
MVGRQEKERRPRGLNGKKRGKTSIFAEIVVITP